MSRSDNDDSDRLLYDDRSENVLDSPRAEGSNSKSHAESNPPNLHDMQKKMDKMGVLLEQLLDRVQKEKRPRADDDSVPNAKRACVDHEGKKPASC